MYSFTLQGMSSKLSELERELAKATSDLEQEKTTTLAQIEEIDALKKVFNIILLILRLVEQIFLLHGIYRKLTVASLSVIISL